ncbi:hypothetical protein EIP86_006518 [Pleurotus ostreatoroseus]|nr:hypothetical protein EIP86_006518 [Pleurotus ostreatoroseus]
MGNTLSQRRDGGNPTRKGTGNGTSRQTVFGTKDKPSRFFTGASLDSIRKETGPNSSATRKGAGPSKRVPASDGPATRRLQARRAKTSPEAPTNHVDDSDDDPIESASGFSSPEPKTTRQSPQAPPGTVKEKRKLFESMSEQPKPPIRSQTSAKLSTDNVPRFNLETKTVKERMKPKAPPHGHYKPTVSDHSPQSGALSSSPISIQNSKKTRSRYSAPSAPVAESSDIVLPISQWVKGCKLYEGPDGAVDAQFWLRYSPGTKVLEILEKYPNGKVIAEFKMDQLLSNVEYSDLARGSLDIVVLRIRSSGLNGRLTFSLMPQHPNVRNNDVYNRLIREWKTLADKQGHAPSALDDNAARSIWGQALQGASDPFRQFLQPSKSPSEEPVKTDSITQIGSVAKSEQLLIYPPSGPGAVNITRGDVQRLEPGQYLNDNLIEFALKLWWSQLRESNPDLADQVHIFNSFFYKKLQVKPGKREEGYQSVRKWTTKFDLFKKKYIVVPINEHLHWYLAIICNPEFVLQPPPPEPAKVASHIRTRKRKREDANDDDIGVDCPPTSSVPPEEQVDSTDSSTQGDASEGAVEAMLEPSTVILSQDPADSVPAPTATDLDQIPDLQYPISDPPDHMDVDAEVSTKAMDVDTYIYSKDMDVDNASTRASIGQSSRSASSALSESGDVRILPTMSNVRDDAIDVDDVNVKSSTVPVALFYGTSSKGKGKDKAVLGLAGESDSGLQDEEQEIEDTMSSPIERTYIFTFDSLGGKHPGAVNALKEYLKLEAKDKKGLDISMTSDAIGRQALVPAQPNYCDCGLYLIHFVRAFISDSVRLTDVILNKKSKDYPLSERQRDWDADTVPELREHLHNCIMDLSVKWKEQRAKEKGNQDEENEKVDQKAGETTGAGPSTTAVSTVEDSDDEIQMISEAPAKKTAQRRTYSTARGKSKAARLRG